MSFLKEEKLIDDKIETRLLALYKELSGAVHSEASKMNIFQGQGENVFNNWLKYLKRTGDMNLKLTLKMIELGM